MMSILSRDQCPSPKLEVERRHQSREIAAWNIKIAGAFIIRYRSFFEITHQKKNQKRRARSFWNHLSFFPLSSRFPQVSSRFQVSLNSRLQVPASSSGSRYHSPSSIWAFSPDPTCVLIIWNTIKVFRLKENRMNKDMHKTCNTVKVCLKACSN